MSNIYFSVARKTGFKNNNPDLPVIILDYRGVEFYNNSMLSNRANYFNMPHGDYTLISGDISKMQRPHEYTLNPLPFFQRFRKPPIDFDIKFGKNPSKGTIDWNTKTITFDNGLKSLTLPELYFILFHEFAHSRYKTEQYADLYAENIMLMKGFNPSQITAAPITSLSNRQNHRKVEALKRMFYRLKN